MAARAGEANPSYDAGVSSALNVGTLSVDVNLPRISRGIYVGVSGVLVVQFAGDPDGNPITLTGLAAGIWHPMQVQKLIAAASTATGIIVGF